MYVMPEVNFMGDLHTCSFDIQIIHSACYCMDNIQKINEHYSDIQIVYAQYEKETKLN